MREAEPFGDLARDVHRLDGVERALFQPRAQIGAVEELHGEIRDAVFLAEIVRGDDVRVIELARRLGLEKEALLVFLAARRSLAEDDRLQRDDAVE